MGSVIRAPNDRQAVVLFLHIPKTGGTTLENLLCAQYDPTVAVAGAPGEQVGDEPPAGVHWYRGGFFHDRRDRDGARAEAAALPTSVRAVTGHLSFGFHEAMTRPAVYVTLLRDPVERVVSLYHHFFRWGDDRYGVAARGLGLDAFLAEVACAEADNDQTRRLSGVDAPVGGCTRAMLDRARDNLDRRVLAAGLTERFDESVWLIGRRLGWRPLAYVPAQVNDQRPQAVSLPESTVAAIRERNQLDLELYEHARLLFEAALAAERHGEDAGAKAQPASSGQLAASQSRKGASPSSG